MCFYTGQALTEHLRSRAEPGHCHCRAIHGLGDGE